MKTSFISFQTEDNILLHGLLFQNEGSCDTIVIHVHGMAGNFYENSFIAEMAKQYTSNGLSFLTFNNRGHDYYCDLLHVDTGDSSLGGAAFEVFEECLFDIQGAIKFAKNSGYSRIILQGHSSGANKAVYYLSQSKNDICGVALISPCDDIGLHVDEIGEEKRIELLKYAKAQIDAGNQDHLMPHNTFFDYLLSAKTYENCFKYGSAMDTFPYRTPEDEFSAFGAIRIPIFVCFGNDGDYLLQDTNEVEQMLKKKTSTFASLSFEVIDGASHSYSGKEGALAFAIINWIVNHVK